MIDKSKLHCKTHHKTWIAPRGMEWYDAAMARMWWWVAHLEAHRLKQDCIPECPSCGRGLSVSNGCPDRCGNNRITWRQFMKQTYGTSK